MADRGRSHIAVCVVAAAAAVLVFAASSAQAATTFVQDQRVNALTLQFGTDTFATHNAFGGAIVGVAAQANMESALSSDIANGAISWLLEMRDLTDLSGTADPSFHVGFLDSTPVVGAGAYDGTADLDWWYLPDSSELNPDGSAKQQLSASFTAKTLNAGPGALTLFLDFFGSPTTLALSSARIQALAGTTTTPLASGDGGTPGHLASEHVDPTLKTFGSMSAGKLAGAISARSLFNTAIPSSLIGSNCNNLYTLSNTFLDVLIGGCKALGLIPEINTTQPDTMTADGSGTYNFAANAQHQVTSCTHNGVADTLDDCLDGAAYSSYFQFTTDRVIDQLQMADGKVLTVQTGGSGSGFAQSTSDAGINCPGDCAEPYDADTEVTLEAFAGVGSTFSGWTGCGNPSGSICVTTMDADKQVTANFMAQRKLTVSTAGSGTGSVASTPAGIQCGATCSSEYADGTPATLTASPGAGSRFAGWSGGGCSGTGTCALTMDADKAVTATFVAQRTLTVTEAGSGSISSAPAGIACGATCSAAYDDGTAVTLIAAAASGFHFAGWSGDCTGTAACLLTMGADHAVTATFAANPVVVKCHVPNVKGKPLPKAKRALTRAHCSVGKIRKKHSARVKKGRVISQKPAAGKTLPNHAKVGLTISTGK